MSGMVRAAVVIPARYASQRFPGKPLTLIAGVPMIVRVMRNVHQATLVERVLVATDDERIAGVVGDAGGDVVMTSPELASGSDRVWAAAGGAGLDVLVNVQGDEPLLSAAVIDALVERLGDPAFDLSTPVVSAPRASALSVDAVTVARDEHGRALYFSRQVIPHGADPVWRHIGVYAWRTPALERFVAQPPTTLERSEKLEQLRALSLGLRIAAVEVHGRTHAVDRPEDVPVVERLLGAGDEADGGRPSRVRLVVLDVDGVLTEGRISYLGDEEQLMSFDVKDGHGIKSLLDAGVQVAVMSKRDSPALRRRARELGITSVHAAVADKGQELTALADALGVPLAEVCFVGDDRPDLPAMALAGLSAAPLDAVAEVREAAAVRLQRPGGRGAVRELADLLLDLGEVDAGARVQTGSTPGRG